MIVERLIERAMGKAQSAQASVQYSENTEVAFENDLLKSVESSQSTKIDLKVVVDGRVGTSRTTDVRDLDGLVSRALQVAEFGSVCRYAFPGHQPGTPVRVYDEAVTRLSKPEMIQIEQEMQAAIKGYDPALTFRGGITKSVDRKEFANSSGARFGEESTSLMLWGLGLRVHDNDIFEAWHGQKGRRRAVDHTAIAAKTVEMMRNAERVAPVRSGKMPVIFTPISMDVLLLPFRLGLDGKHVQSGYASIGSKIGQQIVDTRFSLTDHPLIDYGPRSSTYDDEGMPRRVLPLIKEGVVCNLLYDLDSAGRAGVQSTGHGEGREPTNLYIQPGTTSYADLVKNTREGLLVYYVLGLGQGNPVSGEFSIGIRVGYKIKNGAIVGLVKDVMLTGNVFDALNNVIAISTEVEPGTGWYDGVYPYIQLDGLNVVAS
jgi:PmbA protein